jgi:uncharacterized membrane protein YfbV (UPF0208 family)
MSYEYDAKVPAKAVDCYRPTMTERLKNERADVKRRLDELDAALAMLESNPQVQAVLDVLQKVTHF